MIKFAIKGSCNFGYTWELYNGRHIIAANCRTVFKTKGACKDAMTSMLDAISYSDPNDGEAVVGTTLYVRYVDKSDN